jgi:DNA (cytosine-5)-methyltransferase 1
MNRPLRYGSVCSGIEAASVAWEPLGWTCAFVSEIDRHASAVLRHRFPHAPNHGDFTTIQANDANRVDILVGGTPCQSFSVAGLRKGLADERGNLALEFLRLADRLAAPWILWENVPGVLSSSTGRDFGAFLGGLAELGYGFAYRILDAQFFGVPQRRRRVFVVGYLGDWRRAAAVLFEPHGLQGHPPPSREAREDATGGVAFGVDENINGEREGIGPLQTGGAYGACVPRTPLAFQLELQNQGSGGNRGFADADEPTFTLNTNGPQGIALRAPLAFNWQSGGDVRLNPSASVPDALQASQTPAVAARLKTSARRNRICYDSSEPSPTVEAAGPNGILQAMQVRRLIPRECERLQGFPDDWTRWGDYGQGPVEVSDTQRYKMCGNSMAVPVMRWIGERIGLVEELSRNLFLEAA